MDKLKMQSRNAVESNVKKIAALFPQCVTEAAEKITLPDGSFKYESRLVVDFDKLRDELSKEVVEGAEERYQFTWPDKRAASRLANEPTDKTLRPDVKSSVDFWNTENLYIEGDNLDALKVLRENYLGKVKMIYIDPPYNTGNDFVYNDDFNVNKDTEESRNGLFDEEGMQVLSAFERNTVANGRFHTDWLNMLYPRLKVARDLLSDDGVMLISIDENECINLGKICDEIFGETNFVECFVYDKKAAAKGIPPINMVVGVHEYIFAYAKNINIFKFIGIPRSKEGFSNPDNDPKGPWRNTNIKSTTSEVKFQIKNPLNGQTFEDTWAFSKKELEKMIYENRLIFPKNKNGQVRAKEYYYEFKNENTPIKSSLGLYDAQWNTEMIVSLMGGKYFQNPKHLKLIQNIISFSCKDQDLIIDFFSGSATTAHAVMKLNAEDGGHRKFIMVQLPEVTDEKSEARKEGYKTICQIGEERIRRAGKKVKEEAGEKAKDLDTGFRVLKLDSSNMEDVFYRPEDFSEQDLFNSVDNIKPDRTPLDLLFQVLPELNIELSAKIEEKEVNSKKVFFVDGNYLVAIFDKEVNESTVTEIAKMKPQYFVMRDASAANDNVLDNFEQIFKHYSPDTTRKIL